jgi:hypothetical protein
MDALRVAVNLVFAAWPMTVLCAYDDGDRYIGEIVKQHASRTRRYVGAARGTADSADIGPSGLIPRTSGAHTEASGQLRVAARRDD